MCWQGGGGAHAVQGRLHRLLPGVWRKPGPAAQPALCAYGLPKHALACLGAALQLRACVCQDHSAQGDVKLVIEDISALRPTIFAGVPRVFDRVYGGITAKVPRPPYNARLQALWQCATPAFPSLG